MEILFDRIVEVKLDFDVAAVAEAVVEEWKKEYPDEDPSCIYDEVGDNIYYYLKKFGLTTEDEDDMIDMDWDCTVDFVKAVQDYIEDKYNF